MFIIRKLCLDIFGTKRILWNDVIYHLIVFSLSERTGWIHEISVFLHILPYYINNTFLKQNNGIQTVLGNVFLYVRLSCDDPEPRARYVGYNNIRRFFWWLIINRGIPYLSWDIFCISWDSPVLKIRPLMQFRPQLTHFRHRQPPTK